MRIDKFGRVRFYSGIFFQIIILFIIVFAFSLKTNYVKTLVAKSVAKYYAKSIGNELAFEKVSFLPDNIILFEQLFVSDLNGDTLFFVEKAQGKLISYEVIDNRVTLDSLEIIAPKIFTSTIDSASNFQFLLDYFGADGPAMEYVINSGIIKNGEFRFENEVKGKRNIQHFYAINTEITDFKESATALNLNCLGLSAKSKDGLVVQSFVGDLEFLEDKIRLKGFNFRSNRSSFKASYFQLPYSKLINRKGIENKQIGKTQ